MSFSVGILRPTTSNWLKPILNCKKLNAGLRGLKKERGRGVSGSRAVAAAGDEGPLAGGAVRRRRKQEYAPMRPPFTPSH